MNYFSSRKIHVGIIGTGNIANMHMEALRKRKNVQVVGCCDNNQSSLKKFKDKWKILRAYDSIERLLIDNQLDVVHVLVPPNYHYSIAKEILQKNVNVFIEKPMSLSSNECIELIEIAQKNKLKIGINHNATFHPLFLWLQREIEKHRIGKVYYAIVYFTAPLGQLDAGKFSHWMFQSPQNIIFEQAVHPISQVVALLGDIKEIQASANGKKELTPGQFFYDSWQARAKCEKGMSLFHLSFGNRYFPQSWFILAGQDGSILIDLFSNIYFVQETSILADYLDPIAHSLNYTHCAMQGLRNFLTYALSKVKLHERTDTFYVSMRNSLYAFYNAFNTKQQPPVSGKEGLKAVKICEKWIKASEIPENPKKNSRVISLGKDINPSIFITGAKGFIGHHLVGGLVAQGKQVRAFVRSQKGLPEIFSSPLVQVVTGDVTNSEQVWKAIKGIKYVYHLAHGMGESWNDFYQANVLSTQYLAEACLQEKIKYFIFTSTIGTYYYGDVSRGGVITERNAIDSEPEKRNFYARSKILAEQMLIEMANRKKLPVIIFRPAIVLGRGGMLNHGGLGQWKRDSVCAYWGMGKNDLPFVLVEDVAKALSNVLDIEGLEGEIFNLAGDIRFSAQEYIEYLKKFSQRHIKAFSYPMPLLFLSDMFKYAVKLSTGQGKDALLSYRDLYNRGIPIHFDCSKAKSLLSWQPCNDLDEFLQKAIGWAFEG